MKGKTITIAVSGLAIVVFVAVQYYLVSRLYRLEEEKFDYRYREIVDKAIDWMISKRQNDGFQKSNFILDGLAQRFVEYYNQRVIDTSEFQHSVFLQFVDVVERHQEIDGSLHNFFKSNGYNESFKSCFTIKELSLISRQRSIPIYPQGRVWTGNDWNRHRPDSDAVLVYQYQYEGNYFRIKLDYYVDFSYKRKEVIGQVALSAVLATISLLLVAIIFLFTLRNLLREKKLSQMKTDFINNMTHELKTPLSTISVASKTLENEQVASDPMKVLETARVIARQNSQLTRQINHLLEISKWERKQFELVRRWVDPAAFVKGVIELCRWECKTTEVSITEEYSTSEAKVFIDETMITAALVNLFSNAVKYNTRKPEVHFRVWTDSMLNISIADNGIGIARDEQVHIFDKFYRVKTGNLHNAKGLGLGLYYVKHIVEAHGGLVTVSSKPGQGSTFTIKLPIDGKG